MKNMMVFTTEEDGDIIKIGFPQESVLSFRQRIPHPSEIKEGKTETTLVQLKGDLGQIEIPATFDEFLKMFKKDKDSYLLRKMACQDV